MLKAGVLGSVKTSTSFKTIVLKPQTTKSVSLNKVAAARASGNRVQ